MKLGKGLEMIEGLPLLYIKRLNAIACSDLHLGYEGVLAGRGSFLPKVNLRNIKKTIRTGTESCGANRIIIDGDIKNEFSGIHEDEFNELKELVEYLRNDLQFKSIVLIKGNHDNFVDRLGKPLGIEIYRQEATVEDIFFFHGEEMPSESKARLFVMGHIHPAITLYNSVGGREKMRCFLYGKTKEGAECIILPAMGYFAESVSVNIEGRENVKEMSPVLDGSIDIDKMSAFCISEGETLNFGKVGLLRDGFF